MDSSCKRRSVGSLPTRFAAEARGRATRPFATFTPSTLSANLPGVEWTAHPAGTRHAQQTCGIAGQTLQVLLFMPPLGSVAVG